MSWVHVPRRVWLVAGLDNAPSPSSDRPTVRDDLMRTGEPGPDGRYSTGGRHHATWGELCSRHDLVEVVLAGAQ